ncbi:hypothetical protein F8388_023793 [Cannabis sativa]|uniref:Disease resistance R13L4/SHOC-2-like LRR domain-containing protein n=1 Tax=Cannabis sativa TaxID=3483 RepID=A0A7J6G9Y2_CANSA|nr:hypothetical protein F8388_023793 [Cannabis sativa]
MSERVGHLMCQFNGAGPFSNIPTTKSLRTFMALQNQTTCDNNDWNFRSLRAFYSIAICLNAASMSSLVSNLKHVRYLNLSYTNIEVLPDSIYLLHHLLTLDLSHCYKLRKLPKHMIRLKGLRHLYIQGCSRLSHLPPNIGKLSCLKTLTNYIVDKRKGCQLDELKDLNIGGDLEIRNLENVKSPIEARFANLSAKRNLKGLNLCWNKYEFERNVEGILEALAPPTSLKWLKIHKFSKHEFGNEMFPCLSSLNVEKCPKLTLPKAGSVKSLKVVDVTQELLNSISNLHGLTDLGIADNNDMTLMLHNLTSLQHLQMYGFRKIQKMPTDFFIGLNALASLSIALQHLSSLEYLGISYFSELASLPDWLGNLTTLKELEIDACPDLECIPMSMQRLTNLKKLSIVKCPKLEQKYEKEVGEDWHKISHIPHVDIRSDWYDVKTVLIKALR